MARKKVDKTEEDVVVENISQIEKDIEKEYGKGIVTSGNEFLDEPQMVIPFSPAIDAGIGGGVPEGSWVFLTGPEKVGKTVSALSLAANCQKPKYGNREIWYFNIEGRLKKMNLEGIEGLDISPAKFKIVRSTQEKILTGEEILDIAYDVITTKPGIVAIVDSFSALCSAAETSKNVSEATMGGASLMQGRFVRKLGPVLPVMKSIVIGITHQTSNLTGYGPIMREKASKSLQYYSDIKLRAKGKAAPWVVGKKQIGQIVDWVVEHAALCGPGSEIKSYLRYNMGIDNLIELTVIASEIGVIKPSGSWFHIDFDGEVIKIQGLDNLYDLLQERSDVKDFVVNKTRELMGWS